MAQVVLTKHSPLAGFYRRYPVQLTPLAGWEIADHFGQPAQEQQQLATAAVLADWSPIGKFSVSGKQAAAIVELVCPGASQTAVLHSCQGQACTVLRLTANDYLLLGQPGVEEELLSRLPADRATVINQTGALACFALAGPQRDEVLERSTAMNLRRDRVVPGMVLQSTVHSIRCTFYRTADYEILLPAASLAQSLFEALLDVGLGVGLRPTGLAVLPIVL